MTVCRANSVRAVTIGSAATSGFARWTMSDPHPSAAIAARKPGACYAGNHQLIAHPRLAACLRLDAVRMRLLAAENLVSIKLRKGTDEAGRPIYLIERMSTVRTSLDASLGSVPAPSSMLGPDHEQLAADGAEWFRGVHSGKRYRLDVYNK